VTLQVRRLASDGSHMSLHIQLFGRFQVFCDERPLKGLEGQKVRELLCYLLLHRHRPHPREQLASELWGNTTTDKTLKCLRQTLWQLHSVFGPSSLVVDAETEWVQISTNDMWLDVVVFEGAFLQTQGQAGSSLDAAKVKDLQDAVALYSSDLLMGWNQHWCLLERERLQNLYLLMLDKLMDYCLTRKLPELGLGYGTRSLAFDWARECTHQRVMRLYYQAGNRSSALRQYERCAKALAEELGVRPGRRTEALYEAIKADTEDDALPVAKPESGLSLAEDLRQLQTLLSHLQGWLTREHT
jgi:DNA-binding SARP family transcriptional activator